MKKLSLLALAMLFTTSAVFAAAFSPTKMTISAASHIQYDFNGQNLSIPVTLGGTPGTIVFSIFTSGKASTIDQVQNGYLGWHFVNKIDTCLYMSDPLQFTKGQQNITWNGKDENGNAVSKGSYAYYIWGYDSVSPKIVVTSAIGFGWNESSIIRTQSENGTALAQPEIYTGGGLTGTPAEIATVTHNKWVIGGDPSDAALLETTTAQSYADKAPIALLNSDHTMWFKVSETTGTAVQVEKYKWVPNGASVPQTEWGDNGMFKFDLPEHTGEFHNALYAPPGSDYLFTLNNNFFSKANISELVYINAADGTEARRVDLSDWWVNTKDGDAGGQYSGGPTDIWSYPNGNLYLNFHGACLQHVVNPNVEGDITEMTVWANKNGDYVGDHNESETATLKWVCFDYNVGPYIYDSATDALGFSMIPTYDLGAVSFGLFAPDGTGIKYFAYANETASAKWGNRVIDYGSAYDGIYTDNASASSGDTAGWWYVAHASIKGTLSNEVSVADAAPAAFAVAQNSPNPFNPTTTISFTLAKAGKTTVDVYNVAGQKISTLVNSSLSAGSHSVTWNAAKFSAGVYFYTVKSGDFSKTMKMTLLK